MSHVLLIFVWLQIFLFIEKNETVASVATLTNTSTDSSIDIFVEYQAVGFINENAERNSLNVSMPIQCSYMYYLIYLIETFRG